MGDVASAFYNEFDPFAAQWLRSLMFAGYIPKGAVDARSIEKLTPSDVGGPGQRHFFAGIGVWAHAARLAGWGEDESLWTGSCPCQPFSVAGSGEGFDDERHLWPAWFGLIRECRPSVVVGEQVASADGLSWLDAVFSDMEGAGYACAAFDLPAAGFGAPHIRQRLYFAAVRLADSDDSGPQGLPRTGDRVGEPRWNNADPNGLAATGGFWRETSWVDCRDGKRRPVESGAATMVDGTASRVGRLRAYGNAVVGPVATTFLRCLRDTLKKT